MQRWVCGGDAAKLVVSLVFGRLDYCNAILAGLPRSTTAPLQRVQNAASRLVARPGPRHHVTPTVADRHWLPVEQRIVFKLCLLIFFNFIYLFNITDEGTEGH